MAKGNWYLKFHIHVFHISRSFPSHEANEAETRTKEIQSIAFL